MKISIAYAWAAARKTAHTALVMDAFGLPNEPGDHVVADDFEVPLEPGDLVSFTGPSGSGKSSLLREVAKQCENVVWLDRLELPDAALVDALGLPAAEAFDLLTACGLGEARLLLRRPQELSDGQRYRFRLALALSKRPQWIVADEFAAILDRTLAKVVAFNVRKLATKHRVGVLVATTHTDILDDLAPDLAVACHADGAPVAERHGVKKKRSAFRETSRSRPERGATGRTSLGGITAATTSASSGG